MTGKTKIKIVFLGDQSVGKSSMIEKYIHDRFDETSNVSSNLYSPLSGSIFSLKMYHIKVRITGCNFGIPLARRDFDH